MFLLDSLLLAPGHAALFLFKELAKKAQEDLLDDVGIRNELQEVYAMLEAGKISEKEFEAIEYRLVERLQQIAMAKSQGSAPAGRALEAAIDAEVLPDAPDFDAAVHLRSEPAQMPADLAPGPPDTMAGPRGLQDLIAAFAASATPGAARADVTSPIPAATAPSVAAAAAPPVMAAAPLVAAPAAPCIPATAGPPEATPAPSPPPSELSRAATSVVTPAAAAGPITMAQAIDSALKGLALLKLKLSSITSVAHHDDGWHVTAELVERRAVPDTSDLLGVYELRLDEAGTLLRWERTRMRRRCDLGR